MTVDGQGHATGRDPRRGLAVFLVAGVVVFAVHSWLGLEGKSLDLALNGVLYNAVVLGAAVACMLRALALRPERGAWLLIGLAIACWGLGEVYWTLSIEDNPDAPYPSPADVGYLAFYPLAYAGLALLVRARATEMNWRLWTDGLIAALGTAALGAAFVFDFVSDHATGTPLQIATTLAYPLGDILLVAVVVGVVALTEWQPGRTWTLLLAGLAAMAVADVAYTLQWTAGALPEGSWTSAVYLISAACLGIAAWQPTPTTIRSAGRAEGWREVAVPGLFAAAMIALFSMQYLSSTTGLSTTLWGLTMIAVIVRLALAARENRALLEQVQTDPLTGLGNGGLMRVHLEALCARATEAAPGAVVFLDLNGFKRFNDTYGHPAGDDLLVELGGALRETLGEDGTAYRVGGDEFCALLACPRQRLEEVAQKAATALEKSGPGYRVSSSWGFVEVPREESDPAAALQLADMRMYAQKESRRAAARDGSALPAKRPAGADAATPADAGLS